MLFCFFHIIHDGVAESLVLLYPFIAAEFHLSFSQVGLMKLFYSGGMSFFQVPAGLVAELLGELRVLLGGTWGMAGGLVVLGFAPSYLFLLVFLLMAGLCSAPQHVIGSSMVSRAYEAEGRRTAIGTFNFSGDLGKLIFPATLGLLIGGFGWRIALFGLAILGIAFTLPVLAFLLRPHTGRPAPPSERPSLSSGKWGIEQKGAFTSLLAIGIIDLGTRGAFLVLFPFLMRMKGFSPEQMGLALMLLFAGGAGGKYICGPLAERLGIVAIVVLTEALTCSFIWLFPHLGPGSLLLWTVPLGIVLHGTTTVLYATVADFVSPETRSRVYGLYYSVTLGSGAVSPLLFGFLTDYSGLIPAFRALGGIVLLTIPLAFHLRGGAPEGVPRAR